MCQSIETTRWLYSNPNISECHVFETRFQCTKPFVQNSKAYWSAIITLSRDTRCSKVFVIWNSTFYIGNTYIWQGCVGEKLRVTYPSSITFIAVKNSVLFFLMIFLMCKNRENQRFFIKTKDWTTSIVIVVCGIPYSID